MHVERRKAGDEVSEWIPPNLLTACLIVINDETLVRQAHERTGTMLELVS